MDTRISLVSFSITESDVLWSDESKNILLRLINQLQTSKVIYSWELNFSFEEAYSNFTTEGYLNIHIKIRHRKSKFFRYLSNVIKKRLAAIRPKHDNVSVQFKTTSLPTKQTHQSSTSRRIKEVFDSYLKLSLARTLIKTLSEQPQTVYKLSSFLLYSHLVWIKMRSMVSNESLDASLFKGYRGPIWANEEINMEQPIPQNNLFDQNRHRFKLMFESVFNTDQFYTDVFNEWAVTCSDYLEMAMNIFEENKALNEISYYYIPQGINLLLSNNDHIKYFIFYAVNRLVIEFGKEQYA